ncbi:hypothetical protein BsWGS_05727 [Bradybaena similaris]
MLAVVVISLMLASGQGISLEKLSGQHDYCTWGAEYWCSSAPTAAACDKTDWCTTNYWAYDVLQDAPCSVLQQLVTNIRTLAKVSTHSFLTQNEIAVFIVKGCGLLQDEESRNRCKQLITDEDILFKLLNLVGSDLSAQSVATAVGVCRRNIPVEQGSDVACAGLQGCSSSPPNVINGGTEEQREGLWPVCFICKFIMQQLQSILAKNATEKQIEAALQTVCKVLPSPIRQKCGALVSKYTQQLIQLLLRYPPDMVCGVVGLCSDDVLASANEIQQSPNIKDTECFLCKLVIDKVKSMLSDHTTQDEIKAALEKVCHQLTPVLQSVCKNIIETYEPQLIQMLLSSFTSEQICEKLNMCTDVKAFVNEIQQSPNIKDTKCFLCKLVINKVKSMLSDHTTQDEIKAALEKVCLQLTPVLQSVCKNIIEKYEPQLIQMLLSSFTSEQICEKLNMCTDVKVSVDEIQQSPSVNSTKCFLCKLVINQVKSILSDHTTQDEIKAALEKVCKKLPPILTSACTSVIETYEPQLIQMLLSSFTTEQICSKLKMCKAVRDKSQLLFVPEKNAQSTTLPDKEHCSACLLTLYNIQSTLSNPKWQSESRAVLHELCSNLQDDQGLCQLFVDISFSVIVSYSQAVLSPIELCQKADFCEPTELAVGDGSASDSGQNSVIFK